MKLCPQCEFIYEDDQNLCDMDGEALVYDTRVALPHEILPVSTAARPGKSLLRIVAVPAVAGLVLSALLFIAYWAPSPLLYSKVASPIKRSEAPETNLQRQLAPPPENSPSQSGDPSQSLTDPEVASESVNPLADESTEKSEPESARNRRLTKGTDKAPKATDHRLTIARALPPLPRLTPLPHLPAPRRLPIVQPALRVPGSSQKALIVNVEPVSDKPSKRSRVGTLIKKTARLIKRPFRF